MGKALQLVPASKLALLRLLFDGEACSSELAEKTSLDVTVVRRHLFRLATAGLVDARTVPQGRGRPRKIYSLTQDGKELFFSRYDRVLELLVRAEVVRGGNRQAARSCAEAARLLAEDLGRSRTLRSSVSLLREIGFNPRTRREGKRTLLISRNCPVLTVATEHPGAICDSFHTVLIEELTGARRVRLRECLARGATSCVHELGGSGGFAPRLKPSPG